VALRLPASFAARYGPWAVVTGASSGIGEETARQLASGGLHVVLVARREERMVALAEALRRDHGVEVDVVRADLGTDAGQRALADATRSRDIGLLVANAGFGLKGAFVDIPLERQIAMVRLNVEGTLSLVHEFAGRLVARGRGGIIVTSSTAALQGTPFTSAYAATKAFDLVLAEGLRDELAPAGVDVLALCPGATDTEGPRSTGVDPSRVPGKMMPVGPVVRAALLGLGRTAVVIPGSTNRVAAFATRLVPRALATWIAGRLIRRAIG
jgi:hypothetical protein